MRVFTSVTVVVCGLLCAAAWTQARADEPKAQPKDKPAAESADGGTESAAELEKSALEEMLQSDDEAENPKDSSRPGELAPQRREETKTIRRGELSDEIGGGSGSSSPQYPRAGQFSNNFRASLYLGESVTLTAGLTLTLEGGAAPPIDQSTGRPARFQASYGGAVALITTGADWDVNDHWTLGIHLDVSPSSQQYISTTFPVPTIECNEAPGAQHPQGTVQVGRGVDALINTRTSSLATGANVSFDTAGDSDVEFAFTMSGTATDLKSDQRFSLGQCYARDKATQKIESHVYTLAKFRSDCVANPKLCNKYPALKAVLHDDAFSILQSKASAAATLTVWGDTDLTLGGDYYFYSDDPAPLGFFKTPRQTLGGEGVPIAPLQWAVRPEVLHRFGRALSARLWVMGGNYVSSLGGSMAAIGGKVQYKFSRAFRMWITASGQKDTDVDSTETNSGLVALGAAYRF